MAPGLETAQLRLAQLPLSCTHARSAGLERPARVRRPGTPVPTGSNGSRLCALGGSGTPAPDTGIDGDHAVGVGRRSIDHCRPTTPRGRRDGAPWPRRDEPVFSVQVVRERFSLPRIGGGRAVLLDSLHPTAGIGTSSSGNNECRSLASADLRHGSSCETGTGLSRYRTGRLALPRLGTPHCPTARVPGKHWDGHRPALLDTGADLW